MKFKILIIFISQVVYSQNFTAEYDMYYDTDTPMRREALLTYDSKNQKSFFKEDLNKLPWKQDKVQDEELLLATVAKKINERYVLFDFKNNTCMLIQDFAKVTYNVNEIFPDFKWVITSEEKSINNLKCKKAVGSLRGRTFDAWFTSEIPVSVGPWKFNGLPGLIVEAYSQDKRYFFILRNIKFNQEFNVELPKVDKSVTIKEYVQLKEEFHQNVISNVSGRTDGSLSSTKFSKSVLLEPKYEWEE